MAKTLDQIVQEGVAGGAQFGTPQIAAAYEKEFGTPISQADLETAMNLRPKYRNPATDTITSTTPATGSLLTPNPLSKDTGIVDGADSIYQQNTLLKSIGNDVLAELDAIDKSAGSAMEQSLNDIKALVENTKTFTSADLAQIEAAGEAAGLQYDPLIQQATEEKRQGLGRAVVSGGEAGGFENTQIAGFAAIAPTEGGAFVGSGGELSKIKGQLDLNISKLEIAKTQAIAAAKAAEKKTIRTGKREDVDTTFNMYNLAKDVYETQRDAVTKRIDVISKLNEQAKSDITFQQGQEDRTIEGLATTLALDVQNMTDPNEIQKYILQFATENNVDPNRLATAVNQAIQDSAKDAFFKGSDIVSIMKTLGPGETREITDYNTGATYTVEGLSGGAENIVLSTDDRGAVTGINKLTGEVVWKSNAGVGKTKSNSGTTINLPSQNRTPIYDSSNRQVGYQAFNPKSLEIKNFDLEGKEINFPAGGRLGTLSSGNEEVDTGLDWNL